MSFSWKISYVVFISGLFVLASFVAANYQVLPAGYSLIAYALLAFLFLFGMLAGKHVARPLKEITKTAKELAGGNLQRRAKAKGDDELGQLAGALNEIADMLQKSRQENENVPAMAAAKVNSIVRPVHDTIDALEQKVAHRTLDMHRAKELSERLQMDLVFKEAELIDAKGELAKAIKRKSKKITRQDA